MRTSARRLAEVVETWGDNRPVTAEVIATFHTSYQILPTYPCLVDQEGHKFSPFDDDRWLSEA